LSALFALVYLVADVIPVAPYLQVLGTLLQVMVIPVLLYMYMVTCYPRDALDMSRLSLLCLSKLSLFVYWTAVRLDLVGTVLSDDYVSWSLRVGLPRVIYVITLVSLVLARRGPFTAQVLGDLYPTLCVLLGQHSLYCVLLLLGIVYVLVEGSRHRSDPMCRMVLYVLLIQLFFYATGHAPAFSSLQFQSGFIGTDHYHFHLGTLLMMLNTFTSHILFLVALPLLFGARGTTRLARAMYQLQALTAATGMATMAFNYMARRHLMVWRVFAPKYIFEVLMVLISDALLILVWGLVSHEAST